MKILDYIESVKNKSLKDLPFNEVDALCFAQSSYTVIDNYINDKDVLPMSKIGEIYFIEHTDEDIKKSRSLIKEAPYVTRALGASSRFKDAKVHDFVSILDDERKEQFCAFQVDIDHYTTLVVFRGTDDSFIGWQEDFEMAYSIVPSQLRAREYVNTRLKPFKKYIYLGHSKGGNLAYYAALHSKTYIRDFIAKVYSFDGPGINESFYDANTKNVVNEVYEKFIPEFDIFGTIFDDGKTCKVIKSDASLILQHDAMHWLVEDNHFVYADSTTKESNLIKEGLADFISSVSIEQRKLFFSELFVALDGLNIQNISDIARAGLPAIIKTIKKIMDIDDKAKETGHKLLDIISDVAGLAIVETINEKADKITSVIGEEASYIKDKIGERIERPIINEKALELTKKIDEQAKVLKDLLDDKIESLKEKL